MKKDKDMKKWLQLYDISSIPENRMNDLISVGKSYMESAEFNKNSLKNILSSQMQYLPVSFWIIQVTLVIAVVILVCFLGHCGVPLHYPLTVLAVIIPVIVLLGVREISKSSTYDMWEIEQSSRCQLVTIVACRMLIIGLIDLFCITGILFTMNYYYQQSVIEIILYSMVPFNIACTCYLFTIMQNERGQLSYHLITCMVCLATVFSIILKQEVLFKTSMLWCWGIFYLVSVIFLGKAVQKYLAHEKMIGELTWNLQ